MRKKKQKVTSEIWTLQTYALILVHLAYVAGKRTLKMTRAVSPRKLSRLVNEDRLVAVWDHIRICLALLTRRLAPTSIGYTDVQRF